MALVQNDAPCIIIASSGMATGGRVVHHLFAGLPDPRNTVLFVGYQGQGTRGRQLIEGAHHVKMFGQQVPGEGEDREDQRHVVSRRRR